MRSYFTSTPVQSSLQLKVRRDFPVPWVLEDVVALLGLWSRGKMASLHAGNLCYTEVGKNPLLVTLTGRRRQAGALKNLWQPSGDPPTKISNQRLFSSRACRHATAHAPSLGIEGN
eukprot:1905572-Pleurochrysis_carterae.AAC.3